MSEAVTAAGFVECTTRAKDKLHLAEADWPRRTLCGHRSVLRVDMDSDLMREAWDRMIPGKPLCKQCAKSRQRRIDGRPS